MRLRKDDPVYYKENGLKVSLSNIYGNDYLVFESKETNERASGKIDG